MGNRHGRTALIEVEMVDEKILKEVIKRIVEAADPEKIILFGSYAHGNPTEDSDLDILIVVENSDLPRHRRPAPIYNALAGILIPKDILVYTEKEIEEWRNVPQAFITAIVKKGKIIYEKRQG